MKILIAPNSFKGSLSAEDAARHISAGLRRALPAAELQTIPLADGGDGTLAAFLHTGGQRLRVATVDALGRPLDADYGLLVDGAAAVIEMALASGLALLARDEVTPQSALRASTYGTGLLLRAALAGGARRIIVGLGGSATSDGGAGCVQALGVRLLDGDGRELPPGGGALERLATIDTSGLDLRWRETEVIIASDVENPALGAQGAARVFAPQKGAGAAEVEQLERGLAHWFRCIHEQLGADVRDVVGGGAAGAFAAGLMAFLGAQVRSGVDLILDYHDFEQHLKDAALVITGEGQIDTQTLGGKGPIGLARRAAAAGVPTVALVGGLRADDGLLHAAGIAAALPLVTAPMPLEQALAQAGDLLERAAQRLGYCLLLGARLAGG